MKYEKIVIGIDESYKRTGISIAADGQLLKVTSIPLRSSDCPSVKRKKISNIIYQIISKNISKSHEMIIIVERIRTFSQGFLSTNYIKATAALIATIVDTAYEFNIPVYSVDTRSWKAKIVGTSKAKGTGKNKDTKAHTLEYVKKLGFEVDNDAADSACIALYGFLPKNMQNLKKEN
jgi:hypothetical protein